MDLKGINYLIGIDHGQWGSFQGKLNGNLTYSYEDDKNEDSNDM